MPRQFRLRSLFILTTIVAVGCWVASERLLEGSTLAELIVIALAAWLLVDALIVLWPTKKRRTPLTDDAQSQAWPPTD
jgi:hypothetical protein